MSAHFVSNNLCIKPASRAASVPMSGTTLTVYAVAAPRRKIAMAICVGSKKFKCHNKPASYGFQHLQ